MYSKKHLQLISACIASLFACSVSAETLAVAKEKKSYTLTKSSVEEKQEESSQSKFFNGSNFFMVKGGLGKPVHPIRYADDMFDKQKPTYTIGGLLGREFFDNAFALDLEYRFHPNSKSLSTANPTRVWQLRSHNLLLNLKVNLVKDAPITPYLRAGAGYAFNHSSELVALKTLNVMTRPGKSTNSFAWQGGLGFSFKYNNLISTNLEYMYANLGKFSTQGTKVINGESSVDTPVKGKLTEHIITFGVKFNF